MQASDVLRSDADHKAGAGVFGPHLHRHHFLVRPHSHRRHHFRGHSWCQAAYRMALLQPANGPGQHRHDPDEQDHDEQGLGDACATHG